MNESIKAVIIDDEDNFSASLDILLRKNFPNVNLAGTGKSVKEAVALIDRLRPQLVFLDINLPDGTGFDVLERSNRDSFEVIFITSFSEFALRAFEFSALHYLMKPMTMDKLNEAMERYFKVRDNGHFDEKLRILKESLLERPQKILLPSAEGLCVYNIADVLRAEADDNYCNIFFNDGRKLLVSKPLQNLNRILNDLDFSRIHSKHLINLRYVKKYVSGAKPHVVLTDDTELPISQTHKSEFALSLKRYAKSI